MKDLKKSVLVDYLKLKKRFENGKLKYLSSISADIEDWKNLFNYVNCKSELERFLLYRTAGAFNIHGYIDDADITQQVFDYLAKKLKTIKDVKDIKFKSDLEGKHCRSKRVVIVILTDGTQLYFETDTANSLMYDLGCFFRAILNKRFGKEWYQNYIELFKLPKFNHDGWYKPFKIYYFYTLISNKFNGLELDPAEKECLRALEERAKYTHTLKNMILVPFCYNRYRGMSCSKTCSGKKIHDRLDLTMVDLNDILVKLKDEFVYQELIRDECVSGEFKSIKYLFDNQKELICNTSAIFEETKESNTELTKYRINSLVKSLEFLLDNQKILFPKIPVYTKEMEGNSLEAIKNRSELIVNTLKE